MRFTTEQELPAGSETIRGGFRVGPGLEVLDGDVLKVKALSSTGTVDVSSLPSVIEYIQKDGEQIFTLPNNVVGISKVNYLDKQGGVLPIWEGDYSFDFATHKLTISAGAGLKQGYQIAYSPYKEVVGGGTGNPDVDEDYTAQKFVDSVNTNLSYISASIVDGKLVLEPYSFSILENHIDNNLISRLSAQASFGSTNSPITQKFITDELVKTKNLALVTTKDKPYIDVLLHGNQWRISDYIPFSANFIDGNDRIEVYYTNGYHVNENRPIAGWQDLTVFLNSLGVNDGINANTTGGNYSYNMVRIQFYLPVTDTNTRTVWTRWRNVGTSLNFPANSIYLEPSYSLTPVTGGDGGEVVVITENTPNFYNPSVAARDVYNFNTSSIKTALDFLALNLGQGGTTVLKKVLIVPDGDSRTASPTAQNPWPDQLRNALPSSIYTVTNMSVGGTTSQDLLDRIAGVDALYDEDLYDLQYYILFTGLNDFHLTPGTTNTTPTKENIEEAVRGRVAKGFKVLVCTSTKVRNQYVDYEQYVNEINQYIRDNAETWGAIGVIDLDREPLLQNPDDTYAWVDSVHLNRFSNQVIARAAKKAIDSHITFSGFIPTPYAWNVDSCYEGGLSDAPSEAVSWFELSEGVTASGSTINLVPRGTGHSSRALGPTNAPVRGYVEFEVPQLSDYLIWFSSSPNANNTNFDDAIFALLFSSNGLVRPFGSDNIGPYQQSYPYAAGSKFRIQVERGEKDSGLGQYSWFVNGNKVAMWMGIVPAGNLQVDTFSDSARSIANVKIGGPNIVTIGVVSNPTPIIESISPQNGVGGDTVIILGQNFAGTSKVTFNSVEAVFTVITPTRINATVPINATSGGVRVKTANGDSNAIGFTVNLPTGPQFSQEIPAAVVWTDVRYATPDGNTITTKYVVDRAYASTPFYPVSSGLIGFFEYTITNTNGGTAIGLDIFKNEPDTPVELLAGILVQNDVPTISVIPTPGNGPITSLFPVPVGSRLRLQLYVTGVELYVDGVYTHIEPVNLADTTFYLGISGNGTTIYQDVKMWVANTTPPPPADSVLTDNNNPARQHVGDFSDDSGAYYYGGTSKYTVNPGEYYQETAQFAYVDIITIKNSNMGDFEVFVDDVSQGTFSANAPSLVNANVNAPVVSVGPFPIASHTLKVVNRGSGSTPLMMSDGIRYRLS